MATFGRALRRGLPRVSGGDPWPPADATGPGEVAGAEAEEPQVAVAETETATSAPAVVAPAPSADATPAVAVQSSAPPAPAATTSVALRQGLPRTPGGDPWPPATSAAASTASAPVAEPAQTEQTVATPAADAPAAAPADVAPRQAAATGETVTVRRGLPRQAGSEPWPPVDTVALTSGEQVVEAPAEPVTAAANVPATADAPAVAPAQQETAVATIREPLSVPRTVWEGQYAHTPVVEKEPRRIGRFTLGQWAGIAILTGGALLTAGILAVSLVRWLLSDGPLADFIQTYPGEYHQPDGSPVGFPAWMQWQHFFNVFLMVLIIRSGLQVRTEKRPSAFWSPRHNKKRKISLSLWFHQSLDILWIVNGVAFIVLLFVTGHWTRIVPTSLEVFPNAFSAALQYVSLDWPTENGWVNYNSLQQLAYFTTVFVAAPLAVITGVRMSGVWPKNAKTLNKIYPVEWARAIHFPVMLYFVFFIITHVTLVFATGALRNLNHMYGGRGSLDGVQYADNWAGFWIFFASLVIIIITWIAARPLVLAPIAKLFGKVSQR